MTKLGNKFHTVDLDAQDTVDLTMLF